MPYTPDHSNLSIGTFNKEKSFAMVKGGTTAKLLENEFNEMQWIQNYLRSELSRHILSSGVTQLALMTYGSTTLLNAFKFATQKININGYPITLDQLNGEAAGLNKVTLSAAPVAGTRTDLIAIEAWLEEVEPTEHVHKLGGEDIGDVAVDSRIDASGNLINDSRIGAESSRYVQLRWRLKVVDNVSTISGQAAMGGTGAPTAYTFSIDSYDKGLYIAGDGDAASRTALNSIDGYVYAIELFNVSRRNSGGYDPVANPNGALNYVDPGVTVSDRDDDLFANIIVENDITDLRYNTKNWNMNDMLAISQGNSFVGVGYEPAGGVVRIDDNDPRVVYSVGDWIRGKYGSNTDREGQLNNYATVTNKVGATCTITFVGIGLYLNTQYYTDAGKISVSIDGAAATVYDRYGTPNTVDYYMELAIDLPFGVHTAIITVVQKNPSATANWLHINYFDIIATTDSSLKLAKDGTLNRSLASTYGHQNVSLSDISQSISEITQLIPNADFQRVSPTWGTLFQDDFNRDDGAAGNGWSAGSIDTNRFSLEASTESLNGSLDWTDRRIRFSFVAPSVSLYPRIKYLDANNRVYAVLSTGTVNNIWLAKVLNGVLTDNISQTNYTITAGVTYYVTIEAKGNIYSLSITDNADYETTATTIYAYDNNLSAGKFGFNTGANAAATIIDDVVVTAPVPYGWTVTPIVGGCVSVVDDTYKLVNNLAVSQYLDRTNSFWFPVTELINYTSIIKKKVSLTSGSGIRTVIEWYQSDKVTGISTSTQDYNADDNIDFVEFSYAVNSPANAGWAYIYWQMNSIGTFELKQPRFELTSTASDAFHTKEQRCDLVSLKNDNSIVVTKGTGESELAYRVEEDGTISNWYRDKEKCTHWDRVKVWTGGTEWKLSLSTSLSGGARYYSITTDDTFYISFVGTGIRLIGYGGIDASIFGVTIDDGTEYLVDAYMNPSNQILVMDLVNGLPYGQHQIKLRNTATHNDLSNDVYFMIDAFDIYLPKILDTPVNCQPLGAVIKADPDNGWIRYEETEGVVYSGTWSDGVSSLHSYKSRKISNILDDYAEFSFIGDKIRFISSKDVNHGNIEVLINDVSQETVDGYAAVAVYQQIFYISLALTLTLNKIKVKCLHTKNVASSDYYIGVDAFEVHQPLYVIDLRKSMIADNSITDEKIGDRTIEDTQVPTTNTGKPWKLFSWLANMIKSITGKTSWRTAPSKSLEVLQPVNLLTNGGFDAGGNGWQRGAGPFTANAAYTSDRWQINLAGTDTLQIDREATTKKANSLYSAKAVFVLGTGAGSTGFAQAVRISDGFHYLLGKTVSLRFSVHCDTASAIRIAVATNGTGGTTVYSGYHAGNSAWADLDAVNLTIPSDATYINIWAYFADSCTAYFDNAMLVPGSVAADYNELHPAEELARCQRYYEVHGGVSDTGPARIGRVYASNTDACGVGIGFAVQKSVTPTLTKNGTWNVSNCGQPYADAPSTIGYVLQTIPAGAGNIYAVPDGADDTITIEANP